MTRNAKNSGKKNDWTENALVAGICKQLKQPLQYAAHYVFERSS